ncbi:hypothetical protein E0500_000415 [Streptomyces sp. KM273126]|uniref:hypothetical protein n=1 Tax=Streptomyces sp. KM273126 TaxID=2545247 RepID=UPI00103D60CC|nr:hypothetical protein [Streptomyces sp. KM273126]MBA2805973.1 hypothetical protein [Streptomyces sp. KM273126]
MAMTDTPPNTWLLFDHAPCCFPDTEVVTRFLGGCVHRNAHAAFARRAQRLMHALDALDRVATSARNGYLRLEAHWDVPERIEVMGAIPRTGAGKFDTKTLRKRAEI